MADNVDRGLDQGGLPARPRVIVGRAGERPVTGRELYEILLDESFLPAEQGPVLGYLAGQPVVVDLEPGKFVGLIIDFYRRALKEMCQC